MAKDEWWKHLIGFKSMSLLFCITDIVWSTREYLYARVFYTKFIDVYSWVDIVKYLFVVLK